MSSLTGIRAAYDGADLDALWHLLAEDARWGEDHENACSDRRQVIRTFARWADAGVRLTVDEAIEGPLGVALLLQVRWADPADRGRGERFVHVLLVRDGLITEIRRVEDLAAARLLLER